MKKENKKIETLQYCSLEQILNNIDKLDFSIITIDTYIFDQLEGDTVQIDFTSLESPIAYGTSVINPYSNGILINREYYNSNKEYVNKLLVQIVLKSKSNYLTLIGMDMISDELLDVVAKNVNITNITLQGMEEEIFSLTESLYKKYKECGHIKNISTKTVDKELSENYDLIINYNKRQLVFGLSYKNLLEKKKLYIFTDKDLKHDDLHYLKYLNNDCKIIFDIENTKLIIEIIKILKFYKKTNLVEIQVTDKNEFNRYAMANQELLKNVTIKIELNEYSFEQYLTYEKRLIDMIKPAFNLSPLERYIYAYNIVKKFKPYKENINDKSSSRNIYDILDNQYMVCVGYANLLEDLCSKLGITCCEKGVTVATGMEEQENKDMVTTDTIAGHGFHVRLEVRLIDEKYGIDGIYCCDPTWDNDIEHDTYNFALMTRTEHDSLFRENFSDEDYIEILNSVNIEEFYQKMNYYINKKNIEFKQDYLRHTNIAYEKNKQKVSQSGLITIYEINTIIQYELKIQYGLEGTNYNINTYTKNDIIMKIFNEIVSSSFSNYKTKQELVDVIPQKVKKGVEELKNIEFDYTFDIIKEILFYIKKIDNTKYTELISKYPILNTFDKLFDKDTISNIVTDIAHYVVSKSNNKIDINTLINAISEVYKVSGIPDDKLIDTIIETIAYNKTRQEKFYPKRIRINSDESQEIFMNEENKFDIETSSIKLGNRS